MPSNIYAPSHTQYKFGASIKKASVCLEVLFNCPSMSDIMRKIIAGDLLRNKMVEVNLETFLSCKKKKKHNAKIIFSFELKRTNSF